MTLAAKVCVPIKYTNGEIVYEVEEEWLANPKRDGYVLREHKYDPGTQPVSTPAFKPRVQASAFGGARSGGKTRGRYFIAVRWDEWAMDNWWIPVDKT